MLKTLKATLLASTIAITSVPSAQAASKEIVDALVLGGILGIIAIAAGQGATADSQRAEAIDVITDVQGALNYFGFNAGPVDGIPGRSTFRAIERFQRAAGFAVDGSAFDREQYHFLMDAQDWATSGGASRTGATGELLFAAYRLHLAGNDPVAPAPADPVPPRGPINFKGTWNSSFGKLNLEQYIIGNDRFVVGDYADTGILIGRAKNDCVSGIFTNEGHDSYGYFRFEMNGNGEFDGVWKWASGGSLKNWDGDRIGYDAEKMENFWETQDFAVKTGQGVHSQSGTWALNNMGYRTMNAMVASNIWLGDFENGGVVAALSNDGKNYFGVMIEDGHPEDIKFSIFGGNEGHQAGGAYTFGNGQSLRFDMTQVAGRGGPGTAPKLGSDVLSCA